MAQSREKIAAYAPLLRVLVAELIAEFEAEQQGDHVKVGGCIEELPTGKPAEIEGGE